MPMVAEGVYFRPDNKRYNQEKVSVYQLKYYVEAGLISIDLILRPMDIVITRFENRIQYYRYYSDALFFALGQICNRFQPTSSKNSKRVLREEKNDYINRNRKNFFFAADQYPILSNKQPRNIIEHLDERNFSTICELGGVGGFNVLFENSSKEIITNIYKNRRLYPYTLDLKNRKYLFYDIHSSEGKQEIVISIEALIAELKKLSVKINEFNEYLES